MLVKYCKIAFRVMVEMRVWTRVYHLNRKIWRFALLQRTVLTVAFVTLTAQLGGCDSAHRAHNAAQVDHLSFDELVHEFPQLTLVANSFPEGASSQQDSDERIQRFALFAKVFGLAHHEYIKPLSPERLIAGALAMMALHVFVILPCIYLFVVRKNPWAYWFKNSRAWITAWGTASSAATLPVTIKCCQQRGLPDTVIKFLVPLGCLINMDG